MVHTEWTRLKTSQTHTRVLFSVSESRAVLFSEKEAEKANVQNVVKEDAKKQRQKEIRSP